MSELLLFASGLLLGAGAVIVRKLRLEAAILHAVSAELDAERSRNKALAGALQQALAENSIAAMQISVLAGTLEAAVDEVRHERGGVTLGEDVRERFCWN